MAMLIFGVTVSNQMSGMAFSLRYGRGVLVVISFIYDSSSEGEVKIHRGTSPYS